jgi:hypothetical protein
MKEQSKNSLKLAKRIFALLVALFVLLLAGRFTYVMLSPDWEVGNYSDYGTGFLEGMSESLTNNIATNRLSSGSAAVVGDMPLDQKYERVANLTSKSLRFDQDLAAAKQAALVKFGGVMQAENSSGLLGSRSVMLTIGVRPESFDGLRKALEKIGKPTDLRVATSDKTAEFRKLLAEKEGLESRMQRYEQLKKQGGSLQDQLALEAEIAKVDAELREKLVGLGAFGDDQGLNTIHFSLYEGSSANAAQKLAQSLGWAVRTFAIILLLVLLGAAGCYVLAAMWFYIKRKTNEQTMKNE